jgi:hypothetical protein
VTTAISQPAATASMSRAASNAAWMPLRLDLVELGRGRRTGEPEARPVAPVDDEHKCDAIRWNKSLHVTAYAS